jgi:uncharacterized membrane protein
MTERNAPDEMNEAPVFEALLTPHRSLGRRGFALLMILFTGLCMFDGFIFLMAGAWPILGFCGLEVLLLFGAFWLNYRSGRAREEVSVSRTLLSIRKFAPSGKMTEYLFNPFWARFRVARHEEIGITDMQVSGEGRSTEIGAFLNPDDRESFASAFSGALATVKRR